MAKKKISKPKENISNVEVVKVGTNNYVLFRPSSVNKFEKDTSSKHIGNLNEGNVFVPTQAYFDLKDYIQYLIVFPAEWDLSSIASFCPKTADPIEAVSAPKTVKNSSPSAQSSGAKSSGWPESYKRSQPISPEIKSLTSQINVSPDGKVSFGSTWLLYQLSQKLGIVDDLMKVFDQDREKVNRLLSIVSFALIEDTDYDRAHIWQNYTYLPSRYILSYQGILDFLSSITQQEYLQFMKLRRERIQGENIAILCMLTSWDVARPKDDEDLYPQHQRLANFKDVAFYAFETDRKVIGHDCDYVFDQKIPIYYAELPGGDDNCSSEFEALMGVIDDFCPKDTDTLIVLAETVTDSVKDIEPLLRPGVKFVTKADPSAAEITKIIREDFPHNPQRDDTQSKSFIHDSEYTAIHIKSLYSLGEDGKKVSRAKKADAAKEICTTVSLSVSAQEDTIRMIENDVEKQTADVKKLIDKKTVISNREAIEREFFYLNLEYDKKGRIKGFSYKNEQIENEVLVAGFEAYYSYGIKMEDEAYLSIDGEFFVQQDGINSIKGSYFHDRYLCTEPQAQWGRKLLIFVSLILNCDLWEKFEDDSIFNFGASPEDMLRSLVEICACSKCNLIFLEGRYQQRYKKMLEYIGCTLPNGVHSTSR